MRDLEECQHTSRRHYDGTNREKRVKRHKSVNKADEMVDMAEEVLHTSSKERKNAEEKEVSRSRKRSDTGRTQSTTSVYTGTEHTVSPR